MIIQCILTLRSKLTPLLEELNEEDKKEVITIYESLNKLEEIFNKLYFKNQY